MSMYIYDMLNLREEKFMFILNVMGKIIDDIMYWFEGMHVFVYLILALGENECYWKLKKADKLKLDCCM